MYVCMHRIVVNETQDSGTSVSPLFAMERPGLSGIGLGSVVPESRGLSRRGSSSFSCWRYWGLGELGDEEESFGSVGSPFGNACPRFL